MNFKKLVTCFTIIFFISISIFAKYVIGFIPLTLSNEYFITMVEAAKQEAQKLDVELLVQAGTSHASEAERLEIVENLITRKVDAICIVPSNPYLVTPVKRAKEANVPIINLDTPFDQQTLKNSGLYPVPFIGSNNYEGATLAGERALSLLNDGDKVAILTGIEGQQSARDRRNGFYDTVVGKLQVVAEQSANWEIEQGFNVTQNIIQAHPDLKLIFASNDNMALGACRALKEMNRKDIIVIGFDAIPAALSSIEKGELDSTVAQSPDEMGVLGVQYAVKMLKGEKIPEITYTKTFLITKENVIEYKNK